MVERHPQVGKNAVDFLRAVVAQEIAQETEISMDKLQVRIARQFPVRKCTADGVGVLVECQQTSSLPGRL